ncbi:response regulator transcription factor [Poseidonibacter lekithochrous]|uniref:response regulator transcription factor n=1 Tax=Poseidonibacter TaxID=2321187 RepID=UPI001C0971C4|nr:MULTISPECIES: response regulator transcription factor [Poseidonibacter]MBU3014318.1 response regulator transcription factor [Poseidonibacter lekithochrous]MDO6827616.1 response regulator transcription factor [Poseidonibacter sp. 1_MG-2023]
MKILLMEDDIILNEIISEHLEENNHKVICAFDGESAQTEIYSQTFDLLLLDVNVPNITGFELLEEIRNKDIKTPAIFITSANMLKDIEEGFNIGCDDYIKKPFELKELDLRINNIRRLHGICPTSKIELFKNIFLDTENLFIQIDNKDIHIAQKECEVLLYLLKNKTRNVSIDELSMNLWSYEDSPLSSTIRTYIKNLRKILGEDSILNTRGVGYRFNC